jgi:hypothetical protein
MSISNWFKLGIVPVLICISCSDPLPKLDNMDLQNWKDDKLACDGKRAVMLEALESQTEKLLSLSQQEIISLLGKPDENELYKRNQKFFYYFVQPAPKCNNLTASNPKKLVIRFNAMGLAKEAALE